MKKKVVGFLQFFFDFFFFFCALTYKMKKKVLVVSFLSCISLFLILTIKKINQFNEKKKSNTYVSLEKLRNDFFSFSFYFYFFFFF